MIGGKLTSLVYELDHFKMSGPRNSAIEDNTLTVQTFWGLLIHKRKYKSDNFEAMFVSPALSQHHLVARNDSLSSDNWFVRATCTFSQVAPSTLTISMVMRDLWDNMLKTLYNTGFCILKLHLIDWVH